MEISLLGCEGLPKGCLLSVRAGSARRQAPADKDKFRLAFPKAALAGEAFKVDVLANLGGASVPFEAGMDCYDLNLGKLRGQPMRATIAVRQALRSEAAATERAGGASPTAACKGIGAVAFGAAAPAAEKAELRGSSGRRHRAALSARRYLDEHNLLQWAETLFQDLIKEQPKDPWAFIDQQTAKARSQGPKIVQSEKAKVAPVMLDLQQGDRIGENDSEAHEPPPSPSASPVESPEQPGAAPAPDASQAERLRKRALEALVKASQTDALAAACEALVEKEGPGDEEVPGAPHLHDQHKDKTVARDACVGSREEALDDDVEALRALAKATLSVAAHDGRLSALLKDPAPGALDDTSDSLSMNAVRESARDALLRASSDGRLAAALGASREVACDAHVDGLRTQARHALLRATRDGSLVAALQDSMAIADGGAPPESAEEDERIAQLKLKAKDALNRALLPECGGRDVGISPEVVRQTKKKARGALMMALAPQDVRTAAQSSASEGTEMTPKMLRRAEKKARAALLAMVSPSDEQEATESSDLTDVRQKVFDLLGAASGDGRLHGALLAEKSAKEATESSDLTDVRQKVFDLLGTASGDGRLHGALLAEKSAKEEQLAESDVDMDLVRQKAARALEDLLLDEPQQSAMDEPHSGMDTLKDRAADALKVALLQDTDAKIDALREMAADALTKALLGPPAPVGALEPAAADPADSDADSLKQQAAMALEAALLGSDEDSVEAPAQPHSDLESLKQQALQALESALLGSDAEGDAEQEAPTGEHVDEPMSDLKALKQQTIQALKAALLGSDAEDSGEEEDGEAPERGNTGQPDSDLLALKQQALQALRASLLGSESGYVDEPDLDLQALKHQARQALAVALLGAGAEDSERDEPDLDLQSLKQQAIQALAKALFSPEAEGAERRGASDAQSLTHRAREALVAAFLNESGSDGDSPTQPAPPARGLSQPESDGDSLRQRACEALKLSLLDQSRSDSDSLKQAPECSAALESDMENALKQRARSALESTLLGEEAGPDIESLRQMAAKALEVALLGPDAFEMEEEVEEATEESEADVLKSRACHALKSAFLGEPSQEADSPRPADAPEGSSTSHEPDSASDAPRQNSCQVESSLSDSMHVAAAAKTISPSAGCRSLFKDSLKDLEARLLERNERSRRDNEAMRLQNAHLKKLREGSVEFGKLSMPNEKLGLDWKAELLIGGKRRSKSVTRF